VALAMETSKAVSADGEELVVIRTSDRLLFKRCRRLWGWMSHLQMGLSLREDVIYFWFGSGIHFALEDFHGVNLYGHPGKAFLAFVEAHRRIGKLPTDWEEHVPLGLGMLSYYADFWLPTRESLRTFVLNSIPQLEVHGYIDLGLVHEGHRVVYGFTLDRMVVDEGNQLWIAEYKTAKAFRLLHYDTDEQVTAYMWAAHRLYKRDVAGVWYYQFKKVVPSLPKILASGAISTDPKQQTSAALYRKALLDVYGGLDMVPVKNVKFLNELVVEETEDQDRFIRRESIERNQKQLDNFEVRVKMEVEDMLRSDLPLYPNQTKDCSWSCPLQHACIALECGADYETELDVMVQHPTADNKELSWRKHLPKPKSIVLPPEAQLYQDLILEVLPKLEDPWEPQISPEEAFLQELRS